MGTFVKASLFSLMYIMIYKSQPIFVYLTLLVIQTKVYRT